MDMAIGGGGKRTYVTFDGEREAEGRLVRESV